MLRKMFFIIVFLSSIIVLSACSTWHTKPISEGVYDSKNIEMMLFDKTVVHIQVVLAEITDEAFHASDQKNVFLDQSTSFATQRYYDVLIVLKLIDHDELKLNITPVESGGVGGIKNQYWIHFEYEHDVLIMYLDLWNRPNTGISVMFTDHKGFDTEWVSLYWSEHQEDEG